MNWDAVYQDLVGGIIQFVSLGAVLLIAFMRSGVKQWLKSRTAESKESISGKVMATALTFLTDVTYAIVARAEQTIMQEKRKALSDGRITPEEFKAIGQEVKKAVLDEIKKQTLGRLTGALGIGDKDAETLIDAKVEEAVLTVKRAIANPPQAPMLAGPVLSISGASGQSSKATSEEIPA